MSAHAVNKRISVQIFVQGFSNSVAIVQNLENVRNVTYPLFPLTPSIVPWVRQTTGYKYESKDRLCLNVYKVVQQRIEGGREFQCVIACGKKEN